jgi:hypothetical protein
MSARGRLVPAGSRQSAAARQANQNNKAVAANNEAELKAKTPTFSRQEEKEVIVIPIFNGSNYANWSSIMQVYLEYKGLWKFCLEDPVEPVDKTTRRKSLKVWLIFSSKIVPSIFNNIKLTCDNSARKIWD